jgi:ATP-dependent Clp protease ATP-binding subunit ClpC
MSNLQHGDYTPKKNKDESVLLEFSTNITELAMDNKLDPVIGRDEETERVAQILSRRRKNNPVIIGEPGVGKSAIVEGLAQAIVNGTAPTNLLDKKILSLEMGSLVAGTKYRGQFEERMKAIIDELKESDNIIIFMDEIHTLVGAGGASGSLDAANILKPALARGEIQCIGATTFDEYKNSIEKDGALERRFQKVIIDEPTPDETRLILDTIKERYEDFHKVHYTDEALDTCVTLSNRFISDRAFPDKAIDVLDEAGSRVQIRKVLPSKISDLNDELAKIVQTKLKAVKEQEFELAVKYRNLESEKKKELDSLKNEWENNKKKSKYENIGVNEIRNVISMIAKIPLDKVSSDDRKKYLALEKILKERVVGQDEALSIVSKTLRRNKTAISNPNKPIGTFMFLGNTGVGKTETAKVIADELFDGNLIRIDMSEYSEKIAASRLTGAAPGYVGYEEGGQLTEQVRRKPFSVILFDEIEKAHPDIFNVLLQILDEGRLTDNTGRTVNFRNTIIIMTSNVGVKKAQELGSGIGFGSSYTKEETIKKNIQKELKKKFAPEFLNRINDLITFNQLSEENIADIVKIHLNMLKDRISEVGFKLTWNKKVVDYLAKETYEPMYGARPVERGIQKLVEDLLSEEILEQDPPKGSELKIKLLKDGLKIEIKNNTLLLN